MSSASGTASRRASVGGALALCGALVVIVLSISTMVWAQEETSQASPIQSPTSQVTRSRITDAAEIARAVRDLDEGRLRFTYATKPGVWGDGHSIINVHDNDEPSWRCDCEQGPGRIELRVRDGEVTKVRNWVGGRWREPRAHTVDLGEADPQAAADYLLDLVETSGSSVGEDAIFPAMIAEGVEVWPRLLAVARDRDRSEDVREQAIFWLGQAAGKQATEGLARIIDDDSDEMEVRKHAVFALSQRSADGTVDTLIRIARENEHPQIRESAFFWLAQSDDPRVVDLFEEVLTSR